MMITNAEKYKDVIESFKSIKINDYIDENGKSNWTAISEAIEGCDETALSYFKTLDNGNGVINNQSASVDGLADHLKATGRSFDFAALKATALNTALNVGVMLAVSLAVQGISKAYDYFAHKVENANKALDDAITEYDSAKSSLENINTQLDDQNKKISVLLAKDKLTYAEKGQLEELQDITKELLIQQDIESRRTEHAAKEVANKAVDAYDKTYGKYDISNIDLTQKLDNKEQFPIPENINDITGNIAAYIRSTELLTKAQNDYNDAVKNGETTKWLGEDIQYYIDMADGYRELIDNSISDLQDKQTALKDEYTKAINQRSNGIQPLTSSQNDTIETYEKIADSIRLIYEYTDPNKWNSIQISDIFNSEGIEKTKDELITMAQVGELSAEKLKAFPNLMEKIDDINFLGVSTSNVQAFCDEMNATAESLGRVSKSDIPQISITKSDAIAKVNELSEGFESLDKIMASIKGKNPFDYALLDDKKFKDNFKDLGESYTDFVETLSNSPKDISACQNAFDNLVTAFLDHKGITEVLNDDTKDLVASMLKNMGVSNAEEVAIAALANAKAKAVTETYNLTDAEADEAVALLNTTMMSDDAKESIARYALQKMTSNGITLTTDGDIENIRSLITTLGGAVTALNAYNRARQGMLELIQTSPGYESFQDPSSFLPGQLEIEQAAWEKKNLAAIQEKGKAYAESLNATEEEIKNVLATPVASYNGGAKTNKSSSTPKAKKEKEPKTKDFDWISRRQELLQKLHDKEMENANDETLSYQTRIGLIDNLIAKDKERLAFNEEAAASYTKTWEDAKAKILEEAAKQGVDGNAIIASIMNGDIENQTITDKNSNYHLIDSVQAAVDAYDDLVAGQEKSDEINKELNDHLKKQLELKLSIAQAQTDIASAEASSLDAEIKLMEATGKVVTEKQLRKQISLSEDLADTYYDQIDALEDQLSEVEDGSAEYYSLQSQISQCEASIADCAAQQAELNDQIKRLPIERINKFLELLGFFKENLQNFIDQQNALGKATTLSQFEELGKINTKQLEKLAEQQKLLSGLLKDYEFGSTKYQDTVSDLQDIDNEISSLIQNQYDWNKAILQLPIDQLSKAGDVLQNAVTAMSEILADYDSAISAVTGTLDKQIKAINDLKDATTDEYESKIKPLQDELDTLQKQNEARKIQLDLEKAQAALDLANQQKTNKVNKIAYFYSNVKYASSYIG